MEVTVVDMVVVVVVIPRAQITPESTTPTEGTTVPGVGEARGSVTPFRGETASTGRSAGTRTTDPREGVPSEELRASAMAPATTLRPSIERKESFKHIGTITAKVRVI